MNQNLPPGCTDQDIDERFGDTRATCHCCGHTFPTEDDNADTCPRCQAKEDEADDV